MRAMVLDRPGEPLHLVERATPSPGAGQVLVEITACGVCRTDLHVVDGELPDPKLPIVPGHEIVGTIAALGAGVEGFEIGTRVGVPWLGHTCGSCRYCGSGRENLCDAPEFTGYTRDGGYASHMIADAAFAFPIPEGYSDVEAAPLLCAGLIGHRTLKLAGPAETIGIYGFGAAAHIVAQEARFEGRRILAFTRPGDTQAQEFALSLGCVYAGDSDKPSPEPLDAALIFAPVGALIPAALKAVRKGGTVVSGGIHMSDIPSFPYRDLWEERVIRSVANLTRADATEFLAIAPKAGIRTQTVPYPLAEANRALDDLRAGRLKGAAVLTMSQEGPSLRPSG
ncbi:zinc-dependent alcohol dehydrogenase family protein [Amorphus orientalis]|uniref:alcohol dehydrogenase n=1 Tax=Amorphus orientalis TaxID=649198 RepID=A0AAE3VPA3_9HYPH|nr:zinc-dependent alcohol dehydrogenase family protein [Amorphus orientalis]MDQ0315295.1 propanol-preferring alcohol dehydrogenase [Amorphus orientalis]